MTLGLILSAHQTAWGGDSVRMIDFDMVMCVQAGELRGLFDQDIVFGLSGLSTTSSIRPPPPLPRERGSTREAVQ